MRTMWPTGSHIHEWLPLPISTLTAHPSLSNRRHRRVDRSDRRVGSACQNRPAISKEEARNARSVSCPCVLLVLRSPTSSAKPVWSMYSMVPPRPACWVTCSLMAGTRFFDGDPCLARILHTQNDLNHVHRRRRLLLGVLASGAPLFLGRRCCCCCDNLHVRETLKCMTSIHLSPSVSHLYTWVIHPPKTKRMMCIRLGDAYCSTGQAYGDWTLLYDVSPIHTLRCCHVQSSERIV